MSSYAEHSDTQHGTNRLDTLDLPTDVFVLILSSLHGQDIARCTRVCRGFADLIRSDLYLQYKIELAQNGMVDGESSTLPVPERLQRLRQYSSNFRNGSFDHENLAAHPDYVLRIYNLKRISVTMTSHGESSSALYSYFDAPAGQSKSFLSVITHGSAKAGTQSHRWLIPIGATEHPGRLVRKWAIDGAQDLLVIAEISTVPQMQSRPPKIRFYSLRGSRTTPTAHPAATQPCLQVIDPGVIEPTADTYIFKLCIAREHVVWGISVTNGEVSNYSVEVCKWRTGQVISRIELGTQPLHVVPLDDSYLLVTPQDSESSRYLDIYSFSTPIPNRPLCTLQLDDLNSNCRNCLGSCKMVMSDGSSTLEGHFRADPSLSMVVLTHNIQGPEGPFATHLLIPCMTLLSQIHAVVSRRGDSTGSQGPPASESLPVLVPWKDWGPRGCLRLRLPRSPQQIHHLVRMIPFGSRMPIVVSHDHRFRSASVYVFDIDPLAARHALAARGHGSETTAIVDDVEEALPGIVDPECSAIPYVAYRFPLPDVPPDRPDGDPICLVEMSMTGFALVFGGITFDASLQTWTV